MCLARALIPGVSFDTTESGVVEFDQMDLYYVRPSPPRIHRAQP